MTSPEILQGVECAGAPQSMFLVLGTSANSAPEPAPPTLRWPRRAAGRSTPSSSPQLFQRGNLILVPLRTYPIEASDSCTRYRSRCFGPPIELGRAAPMSGEAIKLGLTPYPLSTWVRISFSSRAFEIRQYFVPTYRGLPSPTFPWQLSPSLVATRSGRSSAIASMIWPPMANPTA